MENKTIVVTGGVGFIGSGVIRYLNNQGITNIVVVDYLGHDDKWKNLVGKQFLEIVSPDNLFYWLEGRQGEIGAFIHLGACSSTVETNADYLLENNTHYSIQLAEYALNHNIRFIYASSAATYGDGNEGFSDDHDALHSLRPLNMYGYSKHLFDLWLQRQKVLDQVVGLKYFNVYGPNEWHKGRMASAIYHFFPKAKNNEMIRLFRSNHPEFGDGEQKRDFIYVKDAVKMTCAFLDNQASGIFNIGMGQPHSWNDLAKALYSALGKPAQIDYVDMPEDLIGKYQNYTCATMEKAQKALGEASVCQPFDKAVADYVQVYLNEGALW